jgi:hypothetical protein
MRLNIAAHLYQQPHHYIYILQLRKEDIINLLTYYNSYCLTALSYTINCYDGNLNISVNHKTRKCRDIEEDTEKQKYQL